MNLRNLSFNQMDELKVLCKASHVSWIDQGRTTRFEEFEKIYSMGVKAVLAIEPWKDTKPPQKNYGG